MPITDPKIILIEFQKEIKSVQDLKNLDEIYQKYLGKRGEITLVFRSFKNLPKEEKKELGDSANKIKKEMERILKEKEGELKTAAFNLEEQIDITRPGLRITIGHLHLITSVKKQIEEIFQSMGFSVAEGPEIETEFYNFDALNVPKEHPAREMQDTFWLKNGGKERELMRTHTSAVQVRYMKANTPPFKIIAPGRVFRRDATDASHDVQFYQLEGLMVDKNISVANFKAVLEEFFKRFFDKDINIRLRPSYFPFVEPGFEFDITCLNCNGAGCSVCKKTGWLELGGAGMVHPNVFKSSGLKSGDWRGFAFGMGLDRLAMMKYKINDIRLFYGGDLRFLEQF